MHDFEYSSSALHLPCGGSLSPEECADGNARFPKLAAEAEGPMLGDRAMVE